MGTNNIPSATDGTPIPETDHNAIQEALANDLVPRNTSGVPTANQGSLGTTNFPYKNAEITSGYFFTGQIISMHTFNGLLSPGHGWMKMDGRIINEANYNTEHGSGTWSNFIGSSTIDGKNLPDMTGDKYLTGVSATTQDGSLAITEVGQAGNTINNVHTHTTTHNHQWYDYAGISAGDNSFNPGGNLTQMTALASARNKIEFSTGGIDKLDSDWYTNNDSTTSSSAGNASTSIRPRSIEVVYYMRIK